MAVFNHFASVCARASGHAGAFIVALLAVVVWAASGPFFDWGTPWQLTINSVTTIVTFLMVFLIQNTQTRDIEAIHVKLDALVLNTKGAKNELVDLEELPEKELHSIQMEYQEIGRRYKETLGKAQGKKEKKRAKKKA